MSTLATKPAFEVKAREALGRRAAKKIRAGGDTPINLYGAGGPALSLAMKTDDVLLILKEKQKVLKLSLPGSGEEYAVFQQIDWDATLDEILHIDLLRATDATRLHVEIPLQLDGVPVGLGKGGTFFQEVWSVRFAIVPANIPDSLLHDISGLDLDTELTAADLTMPEGAELLTEGDMVICGVRGAAAEAAHVAAQAEAALAAAQAEAEREEAAAAAAEQATTDEVASE